MKHFMVLALIPECHFFTVILSEESGQHSFSKICSFLVTNSREESTVGVLMMPQSTEK